jgi:FixJ family two-component response regulator
MRFPAALVVDDDAAIRETLHQLLEIDRLLALVSEAASQLVN